MEWSKLFPREHQPSPEEIDAFIVSPLWKELSDYLEETYGSSPRYEYSGCGMQPGWNVKYKKGGNALCTLYPMEGFFIALVAPSDKSADEVAALLPSLTPYVRELYEQAPPYIGGRWLMIHVRDEAILRDVKALILIRQKPKAGKDAKIRNMR